MTKLLHWTSLALLTPAFALLTPACATDDSEADEPAVATTTAEIDAVATTSFTATYVGQGGNSTTCNTTFNISGAEPSATGKFPVFVYAIGTGETFTNASANAAVAGMAGRGFVAATVAYDSGSFGNCTAISGKARCMFNPSASTSVVSTLCARAKADCTKGIVVGGFSQGSVIATQAKNFDSRVRAAWGMGDGVRYATFNLNACQANGNRTLASDHLRVVVGQQDQFVGGGGGFSNGTIANARTQLQTLTGFSCGTTATSCLQSNGSGWTLVTNGQVNDNSADHCFMRGNGNLCSGNQNTLDANWQNGTATFGLNASLDWLTGFVTR
jgi:hypothetical protein